MNLLTKLLPVIQTTPTSRKKHNTNLLEWIHRAGITINGDPYSLVGHEYLLDILTDTHPVQVFEKAAQVCISTAMLLKSLYVADHLGRTTVYYFYNDTSCGDFVHGRVTPTVSNSDYLVSRVRDVDNVRVKQIGDGSLYFRGLSLRGQVKSVAADFVVMDELDESSEENREYATDRLLHSDLAWAAYLSQPSLPNEGIDREFLSSDQRYWNIKCPSCGRYNVLERDFHKCFIPISKRQAKPFKPNQTHYRGCKKCKAPLDMSQGVWIADSPSITDRRGYHLTQLFMQTRPYLDASWATFIMRKWREAQGSTSKTQNFHISYLGVPYAGLGARVTDKLLDDCEGTHGFQTKGTGCFTGVDQGDHLHIVIGQMVDGLLLVIHVEETEEWSRLPQLMDKYGVAKCVIDAMPEKAPAKSFASQYRGLVTIQYFQEEFKIGTEPYKGKFLVDKVNVNRTESLDSTIDLMKSERFILPNRRKLRGKSLHAYEEYRRHLKELKSVTKTNSRGIPVKSYIGGKRVRNHWGMASNSMRIAAFELDARTPTPYVIPVFQGWSL
ncbi:phage terminase large subunit family protein [Thermodesulfobacteriota bacterium]